MTRCAAALITARAAVTIISIARSNDIGKTAAAVTCAAVAAFSILKCSTFSEGKISAAFAAGRNCGKIQAVDVIGDDEDVRALAAPRNRKGKCQRQNQNRQCRRIRDI